MLNIASAVSKIGFALLNTAVISTQIQILTPRCLPWNTVSWQMPPTRSHLVPVSHCHINSTQAGKNTCRMLFKVNVSKDVKICVLNY